MMSNNISDTLNRLLHVVIDEMKRNEDFARKIEEVLHGTSSPIPRKHSGRRSPAVFDPVEVIAEGENVLIERLNSLTEKELKDMIAFYGIDPSRYAMKWKKRDRLINLIVDSSRTRASKGDVFR